MVEMVSLPLARCSSASCRNPGMRRARPGRGELYCTNTLAWSLASVSYVGGWGGRPASLG
eukprot:3851243-Pyramimonas_sp.AAC.1